MTALSVIGVHSVLCRAMLPRTNTKSHSQRLAVTTAKLRLSFFFLIQVKKAAILDFGLAYSWE